MTLILTVNGPETIWMLADRRLSYEDRAPKDDARKVMFLETTDGTAILGYAGLGATALATEPSDWMGSVLRGRNLPLEQSLAVLAGAMKTQFPQHMLQLPGDGPPTHAIIVTAFLGNEPRLYTIDLAFARDRKSYQFRHTRFVANTRKLGGVMTPRFAVGGSGGQYLYRDQKWARSLLSLVRAYDRGRVSTYAVADHLASLNNEVHLGVSDKSVGPGCIVAWRHGKEGKGGNEQLFYTGTTRDANSSSPLPIISNGMDINALIAVTTPHMTKLFAAWRAGEREKELDKDEINADLARMPHNPDESLR